MNADRMVVSILPHLCCYIDIVSLLFDSQEELSFTYLVYFSRGLRSHLAPVGKWFSGRRNEDLCCSFKQQSTTEQPVPCAYSVFIYTEYL